jgi:hypothetical protein
MALSAGQRVTLLAIDEWLAMTRRHELEVRKILDPHPVGYQGRQRRVAVVRQRGERKDVDLDLGPDDILLDGWGQPFKTDTEPGWVMAGNGRFNLVGDTEAIRRVTKTQAVLPVSDGAMAKVIVVRSARIARGDDGQDLLYPEIDTQHAVVNRMKDRAPAPTLTSSAPRTPSTRRRRRTTGSPCPAALVADGEALSQD